MTAAKKNEVVPSVQMPSADLINFRFDQTDKQFDEIKSALDKLTNHFLTKEEAQVLREERDMKISEIQKQLDTFRWYWRAVIGAVILSIFTAITSLIIKT